MKTLKLLFLSLGVVQLAEAQHQVLIDEVIPATFSISNGTLEEDLQCQPGFRGGFATEDVLTLRGHTVDLGLTTSFAEMLSFSDLGLRADPAHSPPIQRPYAEGCQLAIDQVKAAIKDKEIVEINVQRRVSKSIDNEAIVRRKLDGEVLNVTWRRIEVLSEGIFFELGGFEFRAYQSINQSITPF